MKGECTRCLLVPMSIASMRRELHLSTIWYNTERSHRGLAGKTPHEVWSGRERPRRRYEPDPNGRPLHRRHGDRLTLDVNYIEGRKHLRSSSFVERTESSLRCLSR
jgi:hypothetical protein